jgi:hypothetical protein
MLIRDDRDLVTHLDYIHFNPVKHGWLSMRRSRRIPLSCFVADVLYPVE